MTKILFINDSAGRRNWGDRAAGVSLRAMMTALGGEVVHVISEREIHTSSFLQTAPDPEADAPQGAKDRLRPFIPPIVLETRSRYVAGRAGSRRERLIPTAWNEFESSARVVLGRDNPWPALSAAIEKAELAIIHGDGSMVGTGLHPRTLLFLAYLTKKHFSKPVLMVNHTADFNHPVLLDMARNVYPLLDDVVFRDATSAERWGSLGGGRYAADSAFWFAPCPRDEWTKVAHRLSYFDVWPDVARFDPAKPYLCLGGSSVYAQSSDLAWVSQRWVRFVEHLRTVYTGQVVLTASDVVDADVFRPVAAELDLPLVGLNTSAQQVVDILGNSDAYIGGRWHPGIFALRGGAPLLPLTAKTFKMRALAEMADLPSVSFEAFEVDKQSRAIGEQLLQLLAQGETLKNRLREWGESMSQNCWDNLRYLQEHR